MKYHIVLFKMGVTVLQVIAYFHQGTLLLLTTLGIQLSMPGIFRIRDLTKFGVAPQPDSSTL